MIEAGCYSMLVRCDTDHESAFRSAFKAGDNELADMHFGWRLDKEFIGETRGECINAAKKRGWTFKRNGKTFCPFCSK